MDITKGSLEDISRPASKERSRAGSRESTLSLTEVGRSHQDRPGSLEVLSTYATETQDGQSENVLIDQDSSDEENEDLELQKAILEMKRLDRILAIRISQEKEVKKQGRELHQKLWKELKNFEPRSSPECSDEAEITRRFLELQNCTSSTSKDSSDEEDFVSVFGPQVPDEINGLSFRGGNEEVRVHTEPSSFLEEDQEVRRDKQTDSRQTTVGKPKHRQDSVKKNIELAGGAGGLMMMTQKEKERLEDLIKDLEHESHDDPSAQHKDFEPRSSRQCSNAAENTQLYLELISSISKCSSDEEDFVPVFGTQVPDEINGLSFRDGNEEVRVHTEPSSFLEEDQEVRRDKQTDSRQTTVGKPKHRQDFVKKNIELAGGAGGLMMMTQKEKERLEEILSDESYDDLSAKPKPGEGYQPDEAELDQLLQIDARLQLLLPVEDFLSVRCHYAACSLSQGVPSGSDGERGEEQVSGDKTLQELMKPRDQCKCLQDIQQQLQLLGQSQEATGLPEEQLRNLLMECEMAQSRYPGSGAGDSSSPYCALDGRAISLLIRMPRLTSRALSDLLQDASGTPNTPYQCEEPAQE